jgi:D-threo-aldose 1-dehydrogenase
VIVNKHHELRKIARTDLSVTALGLGTAPLGGLYTAVEESAALAVIDEAIDQGIKYFDTAPLYGNGLAESRLGKGLGTARAKVVTISTKVGRLLIKDGQGNLSQTTFDYTAQGMRQAMAESLDRLQLPKVDIAYIHDPDDFPDQAINQAYPELAKMRDEGIVTAIGADRWTIYLVRSKRGYRVASAGKEEECLDCHRGSLQLWNSCKPCRWRDL